MTVGQYGPEVVLNGSILSPLLMAATAITVRNPDNSAATLYTDTTGTTTLGSNIVTTDSRGNLTFFAAAGPYKLVYSDSVGSQTLTVIVYEDAADLSATYLTIAAAAALPNLSIMNDSFNRADSTTTLGNADSGQTWVSRVGTLGISSNKAYATADTESAADVEVGLGDVYVTAEFYAGDTNGDHGLRFHAADGDDFLVALILASGQVWLGKMVAGSFTQLAADVNTITATQTYRLSVRDAAGTITVYLDDGPVITHTLSDADKTAFLGNTRAGFYLKRTSWRVDNFSATLPGASTTGRLSRRTLTTEHQIESDPAGALDNFSNNVAAVRHLDTGGISAFRYLASSGIEKGALGYGNSAVPADLPFTNAFFAETSDFIQADGSTILTNPPPPWRVITSGVINAVFGNYLREESSADGWHRWFDVYATFGARKAIMKLNQITKRFFQPTPSTAPTDSDIETSQISMYLDEAGHNLKVRVRYSDGVTLKTATIPLV